MTIGINVDLIRERLDKSDQYHTMADISRAGPFGYNTVMNIFHGRVEWVRFDTMSRFCKLLNIQPSEFLICTGTDKAA